MGDIAEKIYSIAVDGPSGAGKSSLAKAIAAELHILYVDTGAIYRTIGYAAFSKGVDPKDGEAAAALLPELEIGWRQPIRRRSSRCCQRWRSECAMTRRAYSTCCCTARM